MSFIIDCPLPESLTAVPVQDCLFRMDQIVRFAFARRSAPPFATEAAIKLLATWTPLLTAADETKVVMSPIFAGFVIPGSEGQFTGGNDNTTINGVRLYGGEQNVTATGVFSNMSPAVKTALDALTQYSVAGSLGTTDLGLIPINKDGKIFPKNLGFIPIFNFRVGSRGSEGYNANDTHGFSFDLLPNWDEGLLAIEPAFDALVDL